MKTRYDADWIIKTAMGIYNLTVKYNSRFTMEKAITRATERAQRLNEALADPTCEIDEHDHIIKVYDFKLSSIFRILYHTSPVYPFPPRREKKATFR